MNCQYCYAQLSGDETPLADGTYICSCNCPIYKDDNLYKLKMTLDQIETKQDEVRKKQERTRIELEKILEDQDRTRKEQERIRIEQERIRREQERVRREQEQVRREQEQFARYNNTGQLIFVNCQQCDHSFTRTICILCRPEE